MIVKVMNVFQEKNNLRKKIKALKKNYVLSDFKSMSRQIFDRIETLDIFQKSKIVLIYWSLPDEVHTQDFILKWFRTKTILLPAIRNDTLLVKQFSGIESMEEEKKLGIQEPVGESFRDYDQIDLVIVPGLAFDRKNNRLGRGKAYYDKLLSGITSYKIGVCFHFQYFENIPVSDNDIKMDYIITND
jgi:5-formyltetrahydrofolate cyclo-ligase